MHPKSNAAVQILKLDHNEIGSDGLKTLAQGLAINKNLTSLSLTYCNITAEGARPIFEMLIYTQSALEELVLSGNHLKNEGIIVIFRGVQVNKKLEHLHVADNQFDDDDEVMEAMRLAMSRCKTLPHYDIRYNNITDDGNKYKFDHKIIIGVQKLT